MSSRGDNSRPEGAAVIERIEQALRERLARLPAPGAAAAAPAPPERNLGTVYEEQIEAAVARAEQRSREAEALIEEVTAALAAWREREAQLRQRLAEWPTRAL